MPESLKNQRLQCLAKSPSGSRYLVNQTNIGDKYQAPNWSFSLKDLRHTANTFHCSFRNFLSCA